MQDVFRIQHKKDGYGPYRSEGVEGEIHDFCRNHTHYNGHPNSCYDVGIGRYMEDDELCGFETMESLKDWFSPMD